MKMFLLDAYALIYRAYFSLIKTPRINSKGFDTSAIFGFVNTLEKILNEEKPTHIGVVFDPPGLTFRHQLFSAYKAQRKKMPDVIKVSLPIIKDIIRAYHIPVLEVSGYEADDVIGTIVRKVSKNCTVFIMSTDKDYGQLVDENIFIYKPKIYGKEVEILGVEEIKKTYSLSYPLQLVDFLGLVGDQSDNIPGCPGIGRVTAIRLLAQFETIENLLKNTTHLNDILKKKIEKHRKIILFSKFLVTIKTNIPINFDLEKLIIKKIDKFYLNKIFEKLEFNQLTTKIFEKEKIRDMFLCGLAPTLSKYSIFKNSSEIYGFILKIKSQLFFSFDLKTIGTSSLSSELIGISFSLQDGESFFVPLSGTKKETEKEINTFKEIFESNVILKIGHNIKYSVNVLKRYGIQVTLPIFDTLIAHYLINPEHKHDLSYLAKIYLNYEIIHTEKFVEKNNNKNQLLITQLSGENLKDSSCEKVDIILRLKNRFEPIIKKENLSFLFYQIELPLILVLAEIEEVGVRLDVVILKESSMILHQSIKNLEKDIFQISGQIFNINSSKLVGEVLFNHLKIIENSKKTKFGQYVTNEKFLKKIQSKHPIIQKILAFRKLKKFLTTYINVLPTFIDFSDEKIHTTYNQVIASTGRLISTNPNLQNIPIIDEEGKEIRKAFIPENENCFLSVDYSQIELRIMAHLSEDQKMIESFRSGKDIHSSMAAIIFGIPNSEVTFGKRRIAKIVNFGIIYGISVFGLSEQLQISRLKAKELMDDYFSVFSGVKAYINKAIDISRKNGYAETIFHRKRFLPNIQSENVHVRKYDERSSINTPIQGSAADIIKLAMNRIHIRFKEENIRSKMIMQVHDELNFTVFFEELKKVKQIVIYEMENVVHLKVPLLVTCGIGKNWLEAH